MKIFISHSSRDIDIYNELADALKEKGYTIFNVNEVNVGESVIEKIKFALNDSDVLVAIITENFLNSSWAQAELSSAILSTNSIRVLPVVVGDVFIPNFLIQFQYRKVDSTKEITKTVLNDIGQLGKIESDSTLFQKQSTAQSERKDIEEKIALLKEALIDNQLTLVCGAGVSRDSSIPDWNELLVNILNETFFDDGSNVPKSKILAEDLLSLMPQSNLILGKYLRLVLKNDFEKVVQKHLYSYYNQDRDFESSMIVQGHEIINYALETNMMKAIVELARPKRRGKRLESIITFNFDDLIECALSKHNIEYCSIWKEGQIYGIDALPIFHVHGFLPNQREIDSPNLVFSEEAYHSQFIDPYSWSNLIQLNTFSTNICLFVGLSLSDPNLRRLLDISWRRNQRCKHYIVMRKEPQKNRTDEIATMLFEQDANSLGLNVIWCSDFSEIPSILSSIAT
ncbi:TIR domain-containing protein [Lachnospiraceae bacterium 48-42]